MTTEEYYDDSSNWGEYQFITLDDIVNNFMMSRDNDDYTSNTQRFKVLYHARRAFREFYYDVVKDVRAISMEIPPTLQLTLPHDYVNLVRLSWIDDKGELRPMAINKSLNIAKDYLQDHEYKLIFDTNGQIVYGERVEGSNTDNISEYPELIGSTYNSYIFCNEGFRPNLDTSKIFTNGTFNIDKNRGIIQFSSNIESKDIVLEYISDGLYTDPNDLNASKIKIHKFAETAIINYIYYELISKKRNVPFNEKMRAKKEYWNSRRITKLRINSLNKEDILQSFRKSSVWIK